MCEGNRLNYGCYVKTIAKVWIFNLPRGVNDYITIHFDLFSFLLTLSFLIKNLLKLIHENKKFVSLSDQIISSGLK